jgi:magnesium transporter
MLRIYQYASDRLVTSNLVDAKAPPALVGQVPVWLDLLNPTAEEDRSVEQMLGISLPTHEEMEEIEPSARLYNESGAEFMTITAAALLDSDEPETTPITFVLKGPTLATVRYMEPKASRPSPSERNEPTPSHAPPESRSC